MAESLFNLESPATPTTAPAPSAAPSLFNLGQEEEETTQPVQSEPTPQAPRSLFNFGRELTGSTSLFKGVDAVADELNGMSYEAKLAFAGTRGLLDTYRGVKQLLGLDKEDLEKEERMLDLIFEQHPEAIAAWAGGAILDPAGWLIPAGKARTIGKLAMYGAANGAVAGFLGYAKEDTFKERLMNTGFGAGFGAALVPGISIGSRKAVEGVTALGNKFSRTEAAAKLDKLLGTNLQAVAENGVEALPGRRRIFDPVKEFYQKTMGEPLKMAVFNNGAELIGGGVGAYIGSDVADGINGPEAQIKRLEIDYDKGLISSEEYNTRKAYIVENEEQIRKDARFMGAIAGFATGAGGVVWFKKVAPGASERLARGIIENYGLDPDYIKAKEQARAFEGHIGAKMLEIASFVDETLTKEQQKVFNQMLTGTRGGLFSEQTLLDLEPEVIEKFKPIMQMAVDHGLVSPGAFKSQAQVLYKEILDRASRLEIPGAAGRPIDSDLAHFMDNVVKARLSGIAEAETDGAIAQWIKHSFDQFSPEGQKFLKQNGYKKVAKLLQAAEGLEPRGVIQYVTPATAEKLTAKGYKGPNGERFENLGPSRVHTDKVAVRRKLTPQQRSAMGEVEDASYTIARAGQMMMKDIGKFNFYNNIADGFAIDGETARILEAGGSVPGVPEVIRKAVEKGEKLVQVSGERLSAGSEIKKFGQLGGMYLPESIWNDIDGINRRTANWVHNNPIWAKFRKAQQVWKISKTAWNPTVHVNNTVSNIILYDLHDGKFKNIWHAARALKNPTSDLVRQANEAGVFGGDLIANELAMYADNRVISEWIEASKEGTEQGLLGNAVDIAKNILKKPGSDTFSQVYQVEDRVFRLAYFKGLIDDGVDAATAGTMARKAFVDYNIDAPLVNLMRELPTPFLSYSYRMVPILAENATLRPWKFAKWAAFGYGMNYIGEDIVNTPEGAERTLFPDRHKGPIFGIPGLPEKLAKLPITINGVPQYLDVTRWIPGGDVFEVAGGIPYLPSPLQPSFGLYGAIGSGLLGWDMFRETAIPGTGREAINELDDAINRGAFILQNLLPNFPGIPGSYSTKKIDRAIADVRVEDPYTDAIPLWQAVIQSFGIKLTPANAEKLTNVKMAEQAGRMAGVREELKEAVKEYNAGLIDKEQMDDRIIKLRASGAVIAVEINKILEASEEAKDSLQAKVK